MLCNVKLRKLLSAHKSHVRETSLFTGAILNPVRNSQTSRFVSVPGQNPERSSRRRLASQSALEFCPIHCPNGRLGQDLGFGGFAFALKLPELLNRNLAAVRANILFPQWAPNLVPNSAINWVSSWGQ